MRSRCGGRLDCRRWVRNPNDRLRRAPARQFSGAWQAARGRGSLPGWAETAQRAWSQRSGDRAVCLKAPPIIHLQSGFIHQNFEHRCVRSSVIFADSLESVCYVSSDPDVELCKFVPCLSARKTGDLIDRLPDILRIRSIASCTGLKIFRIEVVWQLKILTFSHWYFPLFS